MNEKEKNKKQETQAESAQWDKYNKLSLDSRQCELTKKSTQASNNVNYDNNLTQTSVHNIYGENKFKIQYEAVKKEEKTPEKNLKKTFKFQIKINHKEISKLKKSATSELIKENTKIRSDFIEIKAANKINSNVNFENKNNIENKNKNNSDLSSNKDKIYNNNNYFTKSSEALSNMEPRKDAFGENINKENKKKFKVSFLDLLQNKKKKNNNVNQNDAANNKKSSINLNNFTYNFGIAGEASSNNNEFVQVIKVKSFKKHNMQLNDEEYGKAVCSPCGCFIF